MDEAQIHEWLTFGVFGMAAITALALLCINAPYGRHSRKGWGPGLPARVGWIIMEMPAVALFVWIYLQGEHALEAAPLALLAIWQFHYVHRTFVYPFRMNNRARPIAAFVVVMGLIFNSLNAYLNARWLSHFGSYDQSWLLDPRFIGGLGLFAVGFGLNYASDRTLINLRKPGETGYKIPRGGLYKFISCPNYLGEILEWIGFAIAAWSLPGLAFAVFTIANVGPRAFAHHRWYKERFPDYPSRRKALIPFVA